MRNLKKVLSLTLALVMLLGMMVMGAGAAGYKDEASITKTEAVDVMSALGIFEGTDGSFNPQKSLTRAQATKILVFVSDGPAVANALGQSATQFTDVPADHWASGYVAYCANLGIVSGNSPTTFAPDRELTAEQFAKMLLVAMGSEADYTGAAFSSNVRRDAIKSKINENVGTFVWNQPLTREQACQMALNALTKTLDGGKTVYVVGDVEFDNINDAAIYAALQNKEMTPKTDTTGTLGAKNYGLKQEVTTDKLGDKITKWTANGDVEVIVDKSSDALVTVSGEDYKADMKTGTLKGYKVADDAECIYNGGPVANDEADEWYTKMAGKRGVTLKFYGSDTTINKIVVEEPYFTEVKSVSKKGDVITLNVYEAGYIVANEGPKTVTISEGDDDYDLVKDMAKDDVFMGIFQPGWNLAGANRKPLMAIAGTPDSFEGKVTGRKISTSNSIPVYNKSTVTVDGEVHKFANEYTRNEVALKAEGTFYVFNDYLYHFVAATAAGPDGYALITDVTASTSEGLDDSSTSMQVRAILSDGTVGVYTVAVDDDGKAGGVTVGGEDNTWKNSFKGKVFTYTIEDDVMTLGATKETGEGSVKNVTGYTGGTSKDSVLFNSKTVYVVYSGTGKNTTAKVVTGVANLGSITAADGQVVLGKSSVANIAFINGAVSPVSSGDYVYVDKNTVGEEVNDDGNTLVTYTGITPEGEEITVYTGKELTTASGVYSISEDNEIVKFFTTSAFKNYKAGTASVNGELIRIGGTGGWLTITEDTNIVDISGEADVDDFDGATVKVVLASDLATVETIFITEAPAE